MDRWTNGWMDRNSLCVLQDFGSAGLRPLKFSLMNTLTNLQMSRARVSLTTCCLWETSYSTAPAQCMRLMLSHIRQPPPPLPPILLPLPNHTRLMPVAKALFFNERVSDFSPKFWATFEQLLSDVWTPYHSGISIFIFLKRLLLRTNGFLHTPRLFFDDFGICYILQVYNNFSITASPRPSIYFF